MQFKDLYHTILKDADHSGGLPYPVHKVSFKKGDYITRYGEVEQTVYFLNSGIVNVSVSHPLIASDWR